MSFPWNEKIILILAVIITYHNSDTPFDCFDTGYVHIRSNNSSCHSSYKSSLLTVFRKHFRIMVFCMLKFYKINWRYSTWKTDILFVHIQKAFQRFHIHYHITSSSSDRYRFQMSIIMYLNWHIWVVFGEINSIIQQ